MDAIHVPGSGRLLPGVLQHSALSLQRCDLRLQGAQFAGLRIHSYRLDSDPRHSSLGAAKAGRFKQRARSRRGPFKSSRGRGCWATRVRPHGLEQRSRALRSSESCVECLDTPDASESWFVPNRTSSTNGRPHPLTATGQAEPLRH